MVLQMGGWEGGGRFSLVKTLYVGAVTKWISNRGRIKSVPIYLDKTLRGEHEEGHPEIMLCY